MVWSELKNIEIKGKSGFLYLITNKLNGKKYIGIKHFWCKRKGVKQESDWKKYQSSCKKLKADIKELGIDAFKFEVLEVFTNKQKLKRAESDMILRTNAVLDPGFYNANVFGIGKRVLERLYSG